MGIDAGYGIGSLKSGVCTSTTRPASPYVGQMIYETDTGAILVWKGSSWSGISKMKNISRFTASGTWTVPAGVTYAIAYIRGGGGGSNTSGAGNGGSSSVAFASGTITADGGAGVNTGLTTQGGSNGAANSGLAGRGGSFWTGAAYTSFGAALAGDGALVTAGANVTAGASITITVGSGGVSGGGVSGGSGYVYIEYEV